MALTPQLLIDDAITLAMAHVDRRAVGMGILLRELTSLDNEVVNIYALGAPERLSTTADVTVVAASNATGYALTAAKSYSDFKYVDSGGSVYPIHICNEHNFTCAPVHPAGIVRGSTFYPADPTNLNWIQSGNSTFWAGNGDKLRYRYVVDSSRVTTISQTLSSPDEARPYIVASLYLTALLFGSAPQLVVEKAAAERQRARLELVLNVAKRTGV